MVRYGILAACEEIQSKGYPYCIERRIGLASVFDVILLGIAIYAGIVGDLTGNPAFCAITVLLLADLIRQVCAFFK